MLSRQHFRVSVLEPGLSLAEFVKTQHPDLILLDADADGLETLRELKTGAPAGRDIPVVLVTGDGTSATVEFGLELGADDFIVKPFAPSLLALRVRHTIDRIHLQRSHNYELFAQPAENRQHAAL